MNNSTTVGILSGSASDKPIVDKITVTLDQFDISWEYHVISAHRTPKKCAAYAQSAEARGLKILIGVAGLAAALPGVLAAHTLLPVIGVPGDGGPLKGVDALHSIVQMPPGIPVATVGIANGKNAAYLALQILALSYPSLRENLVKYRASLGDD
jgi:5-(carboxyamino)imidazole ribonucleotide mutase